MKMKRYTAPTMVDAMKQVRSDFGDDAIILSSNVITSKGFLGLFQKKKVEVVAGYDEPVQKQEIAYNPEPPKQQDRSSFELKREMAEIKKMMEEFGKRSELSHYPDELHWLLVRLREQLLSEELITLIADQIFNQMKHEKRDFTKHEQILIAKDVLQQEVGHLPYGGISFSKKYINVLGPTGVGKTTTIAKVAARALLEKKKKIGFITLDTYRIAAIEQLRTYANLLQAPVEVAYNRDDFMKAIRKLEDRDLIFIDTAGRNYKESKYVEDLEEMVDFSLEMESFLVLSMTSKEADMKRIIDQFSSFPIQKFIFTKMDETDSYGPLVNLMKEHGIGTAYYTDGQEVPEDIREADLDSLLTLLLGDTYDS